MITSTRNVLLLGLLALTACGSEIDSCDSSRVAQTILADFKPLKELILKESLLNPRYPGSQGMTRDNSDATYLQRMTGRWPSEQEVKKRAADKIAMAERFKSWNTRLINIRQTSYDSANNIRYCEADTAGEEHLTREDLSFVVNTLMFADQRPRICDSYRYQISPLLDKAGQVHVSWACKE